MRLRNRLLERQGKAGRPAGGRHVQAVYVLSKAQQTADRYVADAQEYSRELAAGRPVARDEILREAKVRASMILEEAHTSASQAAEAARTKDPVPAAEQQELQAEITYLRTFSDVCRTHLRAYLESLTQSIEAWEQAERSGARAAGSPPQSAEHVLSATAGTTGRTSREACPRGSGPARG